MPSVESFKAAALQEGFDEVIMRTWDPLTVLDTHTHPFGVKALVTQGEMWLTVAGQTVAAGETVRRLSHAGEGAGPRGHPVNVTNPDNRPPRE